MKMKVLIIALAALLSTASLYAQETAGSGLPGSFYFTGGLQYYIHPYKSFVDVLPGPRFGGGWELPLGPGALALGIETGLTHTGLTHTGLAGEASAGGSENLIPITFRGGYGLKGLGGEESFMLRGDLLAGGLAGTAAGGHFAPFLGARLSAEFRLPADTESLTWGGFAGAGADIIPEKSGLRVLPVIEAGAKLWLGRRQQEARKKQPSMAEEVEQLTGEVRRLVEQQQGLALKLRQLKETPQEGIDLSQFTVYFDGDDTNINAASRAALEKAAALLRRFPKARIAVVGHCALSGPEAGRLNISRQRAQTVADFLVHNGVDAKCIVSVEGHGSSRPVAPNNTNAGRAKNRRVELVIVDG